MISTNQQTLNDVTDEEFEWVKDGMAPPMNPETGAATMSQDGLVWVHRRKVTEPDE